jgi:serine/threonine protein kinase
MWRRLTDRIPFSLLDYTHRDIKPENIAMGLDQDASTVFLFDLGICSSYKTPKGNHINLKLTRSKCLIGTPSYASLNSHHGFG